MKVALLTSLQAYWRTLDQREQTLLRSAAFLVGLALVWWLLVAPPLRTLSQADAQRRSLDTQVQVMQGLRAQALALQSQPKIGREDALRALDTSVKQRLGASAQLNVVNDRATVTLRNTPADALAPWLTQVRLSARAIPSEARLARTTSTAASGPASLASPAASSPPAAWDGTIVLALPAP